MAREEQDRGRSGSEAECGQEGKAKDEARRTFAEAHRLTPRFGSPRSGCKRCPRTVPHAYMSDRVVTFGSVSLVRVTGIVEGQRPLKPGSRFSRNAATPSAKSSLLVAAACSCASCSSCSSSVAVAAWSKSLLVIPIALVGSDA